jgi:hypothetical protein
VDPSAGCADFLFADEPISRLRPTSTVSSDDDDVHPPSTPNFRPSTTPVELTQLMFTRDRKVTVGGCSG